MLRKYWTLPEENKEGYIEASDKVLGVVNSTNPQSKVKLQAKIIPIIDEQKWYRGIADENGWFLLTNALFRKNLMNFYTGFHNDLQIDGD